MSRIDEIKEKVASWEDEPCLTTEEARYLLTKLEIAENALIHLSENAERLHTLSGVESYTRETLEELRA